VPVLRSPSGFRALSLCGGHVRCTFYREASSWTVERCSEYSSRHRALRGPPRRPELTDKKQHWDRERLPGHMSDLVFEFFFPLYEVWCTTPLPRFFWTAVITSPCKFWEARQESDPLCGSVLFHFPGSLRFENTASSFFSQVSARGPPGDRGTMRLSEFPPLSLPTRLSVFDPRALTLPAAGLSSWGINWSTHSPSSSLLLFLPPGPKPLLEQELSHFLPSPLGGSTRRFTRRGTCPPFQFFF